MNKLTLSIKVTPSVLKETLKATFAANRVPFVWGPPGVAKSAVAKAYATERNLAFIDVRLSQMDPVDLRGMPYPVEEHGVRRIEWNEPLVLPHDVHITKIIDVEYPEVYEFDFKKSNPVGVNGIHYVTDPKIEISTFHCKGKAILINQTPDSAKFAIVEVDENNEPIIENENFKFLTGQIKLKVTGKAKAILALEEFNSALPTVQAACYQLLLDRRLGEYIIPEDVSIMALGNRETDKGVTYRMPSPSANRMLHFEMDADNIFEDWFAWALENGIEHSIIGFIYEYKHLLFKFDPATASRGFPTPRSWEMLSDVLKNTPNINSSVMRAVCAGAIGDGAAAQFIEYRKISDSLPHIDDILNGSLKKMPQKFMTDDGTKVKINISYQMIVSLVHELSTRYDKFKNLNKNSDEFKSKFVAWAENANNFFGFVIENFEPEICVTAGKIAIQQKQLPLFGKFIPNFKTYSELYSHHLSSKSK